MNEIETDSLLSCPIVCGEYMRATGFFYSTGETVYLITARHNCIPTNGQKLKTGDVPVNFQSADFLPEIDIYLRTPNGFDTERVDITEQDGVIQMSEIDVLCVPINFAPDEYGYRVWKKSDIVSPQDAAGSLNSIGFNGKGFPDSDGNYDIKTYCDQLGNPVSLPLVNIMDGEADISRFGLLPHAIDEDFVGNNGDYNGLSGAPLIGSGLVGVHSQNRRPTAAALEQVGADEFMFIAYSRADLIPKLLD